MTITKQTSLSADLWRDAEGIRGYAADPGPGPWVTMAQAQAHVTAIQQPLRARITELEAQIALAAQAKLAKPESLQPGDVRPIVIGGTLCEDGRWWCEGPECYVDTEDCTVLPLHVSAQGKCE